MVRLADRLNPQPLTKGRAMAQRRWRTDWFAVFLTLGVLTLITLLIGAITDDVLQTNHFKADCQAAGGRVVKLDGGSRDDPRVCVTSEWKVITITPRGLFN